jgi:membrane protein
VFKRVKAFIQALILKFSEDRVTQKAASLAFFTALSLAPLLIIVTYVAGFIFGEATARAGLVSQARATVGHEGAEIIQMVLENAADPGGGGVIALVLGIGGLLFGASNIFVQLRQTLDSIWGITTDPDRGMKAMIATRLFALLNVLGAGVLLMLLLILAIGLSGLQALLPVILTDNPVVVWIINILVSLAFYTLLFAFVFKVIPRAEVPWKDVWLGAIATAVLFTIGTNLMRIYLSESAGASVYGAAGSLLVLLLWIFYSSQILLMGAEITQLTSRVRGAGIQPADGTIPLVEAREHAEQKIEENVQKTRN